MLSSNPIMLVTAFALVLAWRVAGYYGLDYYVLPRIGAPFGPEFEATRWIRDTYRNLRGRQLGRS